MVDKHEEITLPIVLSCNYQSDITVMLPTY